jgi:60 kDa SS-A/Ro ribonucleoprotein
MSKSESESECLSESSEGPKYVDGMELNDFSPEKIIWGDSEEDLTEEEPKWIDDVEEQEPEWPMGCVYLPGQMEPVKGHEEIMVMNNAGGYTYEVSDKDLLLRILILGTTGNTYYSSAKKLSEDSIESIKKMIADGKGEMVVETLRDVYMTNRAPKPDTLFYVLALLTNTDIPKEIKSKAYDVLTEIRTFSQLYLLESNRKSFGKKGFGKGARKAFFKLINKMSGKNFAYQSTKYVSRTFGKETWSIKDIIRCAHIPSKKLNLESQLVLTYVMKGFEAMEEIYDNYIVKPTECKNTFEYICAVEFVKTYVSDEKIDEAIELIKKYKLPREVINTKLLSNNKIWKALLINDENKIVMPITALLRNLGNLSSRNMFEENDELVNVVCKHITNPNVLKYGNIHPVALLTALSTYQSGKGIKGKLVWPVNKQISDALEEAFYISFGNTEGTGKRIMHAVDCSGSMTSPMTCMPQLSSCKAVATLVMEAIKRETVYAEINSTKYVQDVLLFSRVSKMVDIKSDNKLNDVMKIIQENNFGSTDCSLAILKACNLYKESNGENGLYDAFIVYTDNETYCGNIHPSVALETYKKETGIDAKLIVVATTPTINSIGYNHMFGRSDILTDTKMNPAKTLNIAGFDLNAPTLIRNFVNDNYSTSVSSELEVEVDEE